MRTDRLYLVIFDIDIWRIISSKKHTGALKALNTNIELYLFNFIIYTLYNII